MSYQSPNLSKLIINIDSSQRLNGNSCDYTINPNLSGFTGFKSVQVLSVEMVNSFYSVRTDYTNFKIRLNKIRNQNRVPSAILPPTSYLINVNLVSKNYNSTSIVQALQSAVNQWCSENNVLVDTNVQPFIFSIDHDSFRFTISLDSSLTEWGFILPYSLLSDKILGFKNLKEDSSYININSTNNTLIAFVLSDNKDSETGEKQRGKIFTNVNVTSTSCNRLRFYMKNSSNIIISDFDLTLAPGIYGKGPIISEINSKIAAKESSVGLSNTIRLYFERNRFIFKNVNVNNPYTFAFTTDSQSLLSALGSAQWDGYDFPVSAGLPPIYNYSIAHGSNVIAEIVYLASYGIEAGYWINQSLYDVFPQILQNMFNGAVIYNLAAKTLTHAAGAPICFGVSSSAASLFGIKTVDIEKIVIGANNTLPTNVSPVLTNIVINVPYIPIWSTLISDSVVNLRGADVVYIHSNIQQSLTCDGFGNNSRCLLKLPLTSPLSYTTFWQNYDIEMFRYPISSTDLITFQLKDKDGNILDNQNLDWSISLCYFFDS